MLSNGSAFQLGMGTAMRLSSHINEIFLGAHLSSGISVLQMRVTNTAL